MKRRKNEPYTKILLSTKKETFALRLVPVYLLLYQSATGTQLVTRIELMTLCSTRM